MDFIVWLLPAISMVGDSGQICQLIEFCVVPLAFLAIEFYIRIIGLAAGRSTPTDITKSA